MSLDISTLKNVRAHGEKVTARCPACAEGGHDQTQNHLIIQADGRFGCVVYPGDSAEAKQHRKRIFTLSGDGEIKPLTVRPSDLGRLGRVNQSQPTRQPLKTGLLGRLGRVFQTHLETGQTPVGSQDRATEKLNDFERGVPSTGTVEPHRPLTEREWAIRVRAGAENDPVIIDALKLFNGRIIE